LLPLIEWEPTADGSASQRHADFTAFDATPHAEFLYG
jgi:hypothetical protein